ncbi:hypothetical protein S245_018149, partial [Arachis hypogaea]
VTSNVAASFIETLEANELLKDQKTAMAKASKACAFLRRCPSLTLGSMLEEIAAILPGHEFASILLSNMAYADDDESLVEAETRKESDSDFVQNVISRANMEKRLMFVWDACKDLTLIILMVAAATSLVLGIKSEGIKERWYDGGSIAFAVILVIVVTATSDYKQSLQFRDLNEEKRNIRLEVIRGGRRVEISIYCRWQWCYALMASGSDDALKSVGLVLAGLTN